MQDAPTNFRPVAESSRAANTAVCDILDHLNGNQAVSQYFKERCLEFAKKRTVFLTAQGYLGTGLVGISKGDAVANVSGVSMPLILRHDKENQFKLVGAAFYISGPSIMTITRM